MTIRLRLASLFMIATLVMLIGSGLVFVGHLEASLENNLNATLDARASSISAALRVRARAGDLGPPTAIRLGTVSGVYAQLLDTSGHVLDTSRGIGRTPLVSAAEAGVATARTVLVDRAISIGTSDESTVEALRILARGSGQPGVILALGVSREVVDSAVAEARNQLLVLGAIVLLLGGSGSWLLARAALRPVERMRIEVGNLHERNAGAGLQVPGSRDEIARLAFTFNGLLARIQGSVSRERAFVADAGHELRTPLTVLTGELELARRPGRSRDDLLETIDVAARETERLVRLAEDLLSMGQASEPRDTRHGHIDLVEITNAAVYAIRRIATERGVTMIGPGSRPTAVSGEANQISRAIENLLANALRHAPSGSEVTVSVEEDDRSVRLIIADRGPGFPPAFIAVAFDRFTRADHSRTRTHVPGTASAGTGLGLAIVHAVMIRHAGTATAANRPGGGAEITLTWPKPRQGDLSRRPAAVHSALHASVPEAPQRSKAIDVN